MLVLSQVDISDLVSGRRTFLGHRQVPGRGIEGVPARYRGKKFFLRRPSMGRMKLERDEEMDKIPLTREGLERLEAELKKLKSEDRPAVIQAIAVARDHGDLSENAEYDAARERQGFIEGRIAELEDVCSRAEVIDVSKMSGPTVRFGATVVVADEDTDEEKTYRIVGAPEADIEQGMISISSPLARALIGKSEGDSVEVTSPGGTKSYEICGVSWA